MPLREVPSLRLEPLAVEDIARFRAMTFPQIGAQLERLMPSWWLRAAWLDREPVGLAVGAFAPKENEFLVTSVSVVAGHRRQGIASKLLEALEAEARVRGASRLQSRVVSTMAMAPAFTALTASLGWDRPRLSTVSLTGEAGPMAAEGGQWPGVKAQLDDPGAFTFEPWQPLTEPDRVALARLRAQRSYIDWYDFETFEDKVDPVCSLQVRRNRELVGWILATPLIGALARRYGDRIGRHYRSAYVDEKLWRSAVLIAGYYHAFSRQAAAYGDRSIATYFSAISGQMALTRRRFAPMALAYDEILEVAKTL